MPLFQRGIVLPFRKGNAPDSPIEPLTVSEPLRIPLTAITADDTARTVALGEDTFCHAGEVIYTDENEELPVLATVAGRFGGTVAVQHPLYGELLCAELHPTAGDVSQLRLPVLPDDPDPDTILNAARDAAIYDDLDGIPLYEKLLAWRLTAADATPEDMVLVADATENDIYGSAAWAVLAEHPRDTLDGLRLAAKALRFSRYHIAAMLPKAKRRALKHAVGKNNVYTVGDEYPVTRYAERDAEVFRIGVQACTALAAAVRRGEKSLSAVLTVAGDAVPHSFNLQVPYGTSIGEILEHCHADPDAVVVMGDAMTGTFCPERRMPLLPGTVTLLAFRQKPVKLSSPCIGCGRCATVCHAGLIPYEIVRRLENMHYERLQHLDPQACDGCAACSYICPAGRDVAAAVLRAGETNGTVFLEWGEDTDE